MIKKILVCLFLILYSISIFAQGATEIYKSTYFKIDSMLMEQSTLSFIDAVYLTENSFNESVMTNKTNYIEIEKIINLIKKVSEIDFIDYVKTDRTIIKKQAAIFSVLTDTIPIIIDDRSVILHTPYTYDFSDPFGEKDWSKMFVSKLLETGKGNCHSLPYLYKILADELGVPAYLAFAPNHIYIKSYSEKTGWYNTELTSGTFPIDAWIMASGYVTVEAVQNGLYMDTLSNKQAVANCLVDLAQGYQRKFGKDNPDFVIKCCNTCLKYHPVNVNAMLTKAEAQKYYILKQMEAKKLKKPQDLFSDANIKEMYNDMEQTYVKLHQLGYRRMPEEMYLQWMSSLRNEPTKYNNPKVSVNKKLQKK